MRVRKELPNSQSRQYGNPGGPILWREIQNWLDKAAESGTIYDKNGNVLAQSADAWKVYINPSEIRDEATAKTLSTQLARILDLNYKDVYALTQNKKSKYKVVKKQIDYDTKEKITKLKKENKGYYEILGLEDDVIRYYPYDNFASTVLGFTGSTNGSSGLE